MKMNSFRGNVPVLFQNEIKRFCLILRSRKCSLDNEINNFWGEQTDIWAKKEALVCMYVSFYNTTASTWTLATPRTT